MTLSLARGGSRELDSRRSATRSYVPRIELLTAAGWRLAHTKLDETCAAVSVQPGAYLVAIERHRDGCSRRFHASAARDLRRPYRVTATAE